MKAMTMIDGRRGASLPAVAQALVEGEKLRRLTVSNDKNAFVTVGRVNLDIMIPEGLVGDNARYRLKRASGTVESSLEFVLVADDRATARFHHGYNGHARWIGRVEGARVSKCGKSVATVSRDGDEITVTVAAADRKTLKPWTKRPKAEAVVAELLPCAPDLEHVRLKALVQEINRRVAEDTDMAMEVTDGGLLKIIVEYH